MNHTWSMPPPATLEAQVVRFADRIAYVNHDVDDAVRAGVIEPDELPPTALAVLGARTRQRIDTLVTDLVARSDDAPEIRLSQTCSRALDALRDFMFERVYLRSTAAMSREGHRSWCETCSGTTLNILRSCPTEYHLAPGDLPTRVADHIAGHDGPVRAPDVRAALPSPGVAPRDEGKAGGGPDPAG